MSTYYGNNDWRDYQSLQHWSWPNGNNSPSYNHDYWLKNKAKIMAKRAETAARKAGKDAHEFVTGENAKKELNKASNDLEVKKKQYDQANADRRDPEYFDKDDPDYFEKKYDKAQKDLQASLAKKQEAEKKYNRTLKGFSESAHKRGSDAVNSVLSKVKGLKASSSKASEPTRQMPQAETSSRPRSRKKTYGNGGGNANKGKSTGTGKKVGKR